MPRGLTNAVKVALANDSFRLATLIDLNFPIPKRLTDFGQNVTYNSNTYEASDHLLSIQDTSETSSIKVNSFDLTLSGVERTYIDLVLDGDHINTRVDINRAIVTITNNVIAVTGTIPYFSGYITGFEIADSDSSSELKLTISSHWKDFEKINCRKTNPTSNRRYFPDETGFDFAHKSITDMKWGRK